MQGCLGLLLASIAVGVAVFDAQGADEFGGL